MKSLLFMTVFVVLWGCSKKIDKDYCEDLAMKTYLGHPPSTHLFEKHCIKMKLDINVATCQAIFTRVTTQKYNKDLFIKEFGEKALGCLTSDQKKKYISI